MRDGVLIWAQPPSPASAADATHFELVALQTKPMLQSLDDAQSVRHVPGESTHRYGAHGVRSPLEEIDTVWSSVQAEPPSFRHRPSTQ